MRYFKQSCRLRTSIHVDYSVDLWGKKQKQMEYTWTVALYISEISVTSYHSI